jgi:NhaP-type Na+/H+ or K+/H+ antiporter
MSHLQGMIVFAVVVSLAFGFLGRRRPLDRVKYFFWCLLLFLLVGVAVGWAMYPFSR